MKEYEQQIDDLINSGDVNNWRLALELCRGLNIEDAKLVIGTKCHGTLNKEEGSNIDDRRKFIETECECDWAPDSNYRFIILKCRTTNKQLRSNFMI